MTKCKLNVPNQCIACTAGIISANHCEFICSGIALRGSSSNSSFDIANSTFYLTTDSSMGISSSHGHKTSVSDCNFIQGMCGIMIDSEAICDVKNSKFSGCKFGCRSRDSSLKLSYCSMSECQKCVYSFGPKGILHAKDSKFEKIALVCLESVSESCITLERCSVENSAICAIKATASGNILLTDCNFLNCSTKVSVATGSSKISIIGCSFNSISGNGFDFSENSIGKFENVNFRCCSGIGVQLSRSKLSMTTTNMSSVLMHCILCKSGSSLEAKQCTFEFCNGYCIANELTDGSIVQVEHGIQFDNINFEGCNI
jgi:hypothetical protein